ncbi:MAG TPA: sulfatase-like hydrolase/transferase [Longimicrobium sp.]|nr:sulfatase-like hydrolase/transferase [Longimicrobium sp.]
MSQSDNGSGAPAKPDRPNVLLITVDEMRYPRFGYGPDAGMLEPIKEILGFVGDPADNPYARFFPGFLALRKNAVVLKNHTIAASACTPSRGVIYTGQYGTRTGLTQTDGVFKSGSDPAFPWLDPEGIPTMGDWFRAAGYTTHYFGKWHVSEAHDGSLEPWGFSDWELSTPEPHGSNPNNLGVFRDVGFTDNAVGFLHRRALAVNETTQPAPWLAVASLTNPHDIAGYPMPWFAGVETPLPPAGAPRPIPPQGAVSNAPQFGSWRLPLNPDGFPQESFNPSPTGDEDLSTKPDCQLDSAYKVGLALKSRWTPQPLRARAPLPFQLSDDPAGWQLANGQFYTYLHYLVDIQLRRIVDAVQNTGLADNTLVVFFSDHGDYAGAHGGMVQKWHTAYAEALHVPCVVSAPWLNPDESRMRYVDALTSHVDIVPTVLGLAGFDADAREALRQSMTGQDTQYPLVGADLTPVIEGATDQVTEADGSPRKAVLFITDDTITEPIPNEVGNSSFQYFLADVARLADTGAAPVRRGVVVEPCHVQAVRDHEWKLARYWDPHGNAADQWELYAQLHDPNEEVNLVGWGADGEPYVRAEAIPDDWGLSPREADAALVRMRALLAEYRERMLGIPTLPGGDGDHEARRVRVGAGFVVASRLEEGAIAP